MLTVTTGGHPPGLSSAGSIQYANRIGRPQPRQPAALRADRARSQDREEPDRLGLARADRLPQGRRAAGRGTVAAASGAAAGPRLRVAPDGCAGPRIRAVKAGRIHCDTWRIYVSVAVPLRGAAFARRGDRPAA